MVEVHSKGSKCCCCQCDAHCVNIGSLVPECNACGEIPLDYSVGGFCGATNAPGYFACCDGFFSLAHLLVGAANSCVKKSIDFTCPNGVLLNWVLDLAESCTEPVLRLLGSDGLSVVYRLREGMPPYEPLCSTMMEIYLAESVSGTTIAKDFCGVPRYLCLSTLDPCCWGRTTPLPRTLTLGITGNADCGCSTSTVSLAWNPATSKWEGVGDFGSCGGTVDVKIWCIRSVPSGNTTFDGTMVVTPAGNTGCNADISLAGRFTIEQCDPLHLRWSFSMPGCCGSTMGNTVFDVTE